MTNIDYSELSLVELEQIEKDVKKAIASYHDRKQKQAIAELNRMAQELGFTSAEAALGVEPGRKKARSEVVPYYRNPNDHREVCGKRGRKPNWFNKLREDGMTEEQLMISNQ